MTVVLKITAPWVKDPASLVVVVYKGRYNAFDAFTVWEVTIPEKTPPPWSKVTPIPPTAPTLIDLAVIIPVTVVSVEVSELVVPWTVRSPVTVILPTWILGDPVRPWALTETVAVAALPEVSWLPEVLTPGRLILPVPSNETPPIVLAVSNAVAVAAFPVTSPLNDVQLRFQLQ